MKTQYIILIVIAFIVITKLKGKKVTRDLWEPVSDDLIGSDDVAPDSQLGSDLGGGLI